MFKSEALETQEAEGEFPVLTACTVMGTLSRGMQGDLQGMQLLTVRQQS